MRKQEQQEVPMDSGTHSCLQLIAAPMIAAEKELASFAGAVEELYGCEQARQSVEDWMEQLDSMDWLQADVVRDWRRLTIAAATRLASRVKAAGGNIICAPGSMGMIRAANAMHEQQAL